MQHVDDPHAAGREGAPRFDMSDDGHGGGKAVPETVRTRRARSSQRPESRTIPRPGQALLRRGQQPRQHRHRRLVPDDENRVHPRADFGAVNLPDGALDSVAVHTVQSLEKAFPAARVEAGFLPDLGDGQPGRAKGGQGLLRARRLRDDRHVNVADDSRDRRRLRRGLLPAPRGQRAGAVPGGESGFAVAHENESRHGARLSPIGPIE